MLGSAVPGERSVGIGSASIQMSNQLQTVVGLTKSPLFEIKASDACTLGPKFEFPSMLKMKVMENGQWVIKQQLSMEEFLKIGGNKNTENVHGAGDAKMVTQGEDIGDLAPSSSSASFEDELYDEIGQGYGGDGYGYSEEDDTNFTPNA